MPIHTRKMDWTSTILNVQYNIYKSHNGTMNKVLIEQQLLVNITFILICEFGLVFHYFKFIRKETIVLKYI